MMACQIGAGSAGLTRTMPSASTLPALPPPSQLRMFNGAAHAHSAHKLIYRFRKWPTQEAHTRGVAKRCDAAAGTDDNAVAPWQVT